MGNPENKKWNFTDASATQTINYANNLKNAKILLVTRSVRHYAVRKYTEGALAGCLLIGNIPPERQDGIHLLYNFLFARISSIYG